MSIFDSVKPADYIIQGANALGDGVSSLLGEKRRMEDIARAEAQGNEALPDPLNMYFNNMFKRIEAGEDPVALASEAKQTLGVGAPAPKGAQGSPGARPQQVQGTPQVQAGAAPSPAPEASPGPGKPMYQFKRKDLPAIQAAAPYVKNDAMERKAEADRAAGERKLQVQEAAKQSRHADRMMLGYDKLSSAEKQTHERVVAQLAGVNARREATRARLESAMAAVGVANRNAATAESRAALGALALRSGNVLRMYNALEAAQGKAATSRDFTSPEMQKLIADIEKEQDGLEAQLSSIESVLSPSMNLERTITNKVTAPPKAQPQQAPKRKPGLYQLKDGRKVRVDANGNKTLVP